MKRILLADAGSTKVEWALISQAGEIENTIVVSGLNALLAEQDEVKGLLFRLLRIFRAIKELKRSIIMARDVPLNPYVPKWKQH